jgi:HlyD family secretion protein
VKIAIIVVVSVVVLGGIVVGVGWWMRDKMMAQLDKPTPVRVEPPERGALVEIVSAPGEIEPKTNVSISARVSARIVELPHEEGDRVTKGDPSADPPVPPSVLLRLDDSDLRAGLESAEAHRAAQEAEIRVARARIASQQSTIEGVRASLAEAKRQFARQEVLRKTGDVSQSDLDQARCRVEELTAQRESAVKTLSSQQLNLEVMQHRLRAADAAIAQAREMLSYTTITSPIDGIVTKVNAEVGELVITGTMNNPGTVILEVADLSKMMVMARVDESDIGAVEPGQRARMEIRAYPDEDFEGVVETVPLVGSGMSQTAKEFRVEILLKGGKRRMYSGLSADVEIETRRHENVLKVPSQAVLGRRVDELPAKIRDGNPNVDDKKTFAAVVYCFRDGKAVVTPVTVGPSDETHTAIRSGLGKSDRIITGPYKVLEKLKHDQKVKDEKAQAAAKPPAAKPPATRPAATRPAATVPARP